MDFAETNGGAAGWARNTIASEHDKARFVARRAMLGVDRCKGLGL
jgi:hypothetical protein